MAGVEELSGGVVRLVEDALEIGATDAIASWAFERQQGRDGAGRRGLLWLLLDFPVFPGFVSVGRGGGGGLWLTVTCGVGTVLETRLLGLALVSIGVPATFERVGR